VPKSIEIDRKKRLRDGGRIFAGGHRHLRL